jgi:hydrophobe/amphiphile efflux-1 (HAE1) family protein
MATAVFAFKQVPAGFIPPQDQGYFIVVVQMPPGASLDRTDRVVREVSARLLKVPGVGNTVGFAGFSGATFTNASNAGAIFPTLTNFEDRKKKNIDYDTLFANVQKAVQGIDDNALIFVIKPPPVSGIGNGGGFKMMVEDRAGLGPAALEGAVWQLAGAANQSGVAAGAFSLFENKTPQLFLNIDREKAERLGVPVDRAFAALNVFLGSSYVNDFNYLGRTYHVTAQADENYRRTPEDVLRLRVPSTTGAMVPLGSFVTLENRTAPSRVPRYNLYPAAELQGDTAPGHSSGEVLDTMEKLAKKMLPQGLDFEWTELAYQQKTAGNTSVLAFGMAVVFVFLMLSALYESWVLPLSIILIVPMCLLSAITGVWVMSMDDNILTQIGFVVLIGLACKNAILIVEFAKDREAQGETRWQAAEDAAHLRLRPILMTSFAFILGVVPLVVATGAGAEMRKALGVTVFAGMIGVTAFGLIFTPVFYTLCRALGEKIARIKDRNAPIQHDTGHQDFVEHDVEEHH